MRDSRNIKVRHHRLPTNAVLPLFDSLFGVAITLLAYSVPDHLMSAMDAVKLGQTVGLYLLTGIALTLYWYKLRRLIHISRILLPTQLILGMMSLLLIVMMPKLAQLQAIEGGGFGDLYNWTPSQIVNTIFIFFLAFVDGVCYTYARSLHRHPYIRSKDRLGLRARLHVQVVGFSAMIGLGILEIVSSRFNNEYLLLVPLILIVEEWWLGSRLGTLTED
jgi:uncharacterized membrane protein